MSTLSCNGVELYYEITGQGKPVVLIHGLGSSTRDWEKQVTELSKDWRVITFDVRGHGKSNKPPGPYSIPQFSDDTAELIRQLDLGPVPVVGLSMGGMIAFQLAIDEPQLVHSLVIVNSTPEVKLTTLRARWEFLFRKLTVRLFGMHKMGEILAKRLLPKPEQEALLRILVNRWAENDKRAYLASLNAIIGWSVADRIAAIDCPTLVVTADQDYSPVAHKEDYAARMQNARVSVIDDSRHMLPLERPREFNSALIAFLNAE
jgi:pimeloyl-ACP methyl ester carboxylesterase